MIYNAIYRSQIIDSTKGKIRQHPCPRVAEYFITKLREKIFSLNCTINRLFMKSGKHQKGIFLVCEFRQQQGTGFLGFPVFINPSLGLYICDICSGFIVSRFLITKPKFSQVLEEKFRQFLSKNKNRILFFSSFQISVLYHTN